jgi:hypothetical protein
MKNISNYKKVIPFALLAVILFVASSIIILKISHVKKEKTESQNKMYVCALEPQIIRDKPGDCPICGMALIEKKDFDKNYAGSRLVDVVCPANETVLASVRTVNPVRDEHWLLPGIKIHKSIEAGEWNSLWVPKSAVTSMGMHDAVFEKEDSIFIATVVITGTHSGDNIEIRAGLDENSTIAADASLLADKDGFINTPAR